MYEIDDVLHACVGCCAGGMHSAAVWGVMMGEEEGRGEQEGRELIEA